MADNQQMNRPFGGTWKPNKTGLVQYTPDCIVFINGDIELSTTQVARKKLPLQPFITQVSVDAGIEPGSHSASVTLSVPRNFASAYFKDGEMALRPGLEVHIYIRGYMPIPGIAAQGDTTVLDSLKAATAKLQESNNSKVEEMALRPWYHCFHGVIISATHSYSSGTWDAGFECAGMLHFWQFMDMSTNASIFGSRPRGSQMQSSLVGHNFTNMTPFSIIYSLYRDTAGAAGAVAFALSSSTNVSAVVGDDMSMFQATQLYWQRRFSQRMYGLKMYGANGEMFNTAQAALVGRLSSGDLSRAAAANYNAASAQTHSAASPHLADPPAHRAADHVPGSPHIPAIEFDETTMRRRSSETSGIPVAVHQLKAYVTDISQYGSINLFESSYESKLDIAQAATTACGYEFYQDVGGDLIFKPPLYNLDTSISPAYRIRPLDLISINFTENEPVATYMTIKGEQFSNMNGLGLSGEFGVRGNYIDYPLVAKFGWRPGDMDAAFYSTGRAAFWAAVSHLDVLNAGTNSCSITIPIRPELRTGHPIYVEHIDCFYYIAGLAHSFSFGGSCTTTLQLTAKRAKWIPPGDPTKKGIEAVTLDKPHYPPKPLFATDMSGQHVKGVGFPNVVMSLDVNKADPLLWAFGADLTNLGNPNTISNLIHDLWERGRIWRQTTTGGTYAAPASTQNADQTFDEFDPIATGGTYCISLTNLEITALGDRHGQPYYDNSLVRGGVGDVGSQDVNGTMTPTTTTTFSFTMDNLLSQATHYLNQLAAVEDTYNEGLRENPNSNAVRVAYSAALEQLETNLKSGATTDPSGAAIPGGGGEGSASIFHLMQIVQYFQTNGVGGVNEGANYNPARLSSAGLSTLLADRKAAFSNNNTPGYYRYYSSSHPDPVHHAHGGSVHNARTATGRVQMTDIPSAVVCDTANLAEGIENPRVRALFKPTNQIAANTTTGEVGYPPFLSSTDMEAGSDNPSPIATGFVQFYRNPGEAAGEMNPPRGFKVAGSQGLATVVLPSHAIYKLEFARHKLKTYQIVAARGTGSAPAVPKLGNHRYGSGPEIVAALSNRFGAFGISGAPETPVGDIFTTFVQNMVIELPQYEGRDSKAGSSGWPGTSSMTTAYNARAAELDDYGVVNGNTWNIDANRIWMSYMNPRQGCEYGSHGRSQGPRSAATQRDGTSGEMMDRCPLSRLPGSWHRVRTRTYYEGGTAPVGGSDTFDEGKVKKLVVFAEACADFSEEIRRRLYWVVQIYCAQFHAVHRGHQDDESMADWRKLNELLENIGTATGYDGLALRGYFTLALEGRAGGTRVNFTSPVFPISDDAGYEHYGAHAYGRGLDISPGGTMQELHEQDPIGSVDPAAVEAVVNSILGRRNETNATYGANIAELGAKILEMEAAAPGTIAGAQIFQPIWADYLAASTEAARSQVLQRGLMNVFEQGTGIPLRQTVTNSAFGLADLIPDYGIEGGATSIGRAFNDSDLHVADSFLRLEAFDPDNYLMIGSVEPGGADVGARVAEWVSSEMAAKAADWAMSQAALRGRTEVPAALADFSSIGEGFMDSSWGTIFRDDHAPSSAMEGSLAALSQVGDDFTAAHKASTNMWDNLGSALGKIADASPAGSSNVGYESGDTWQGPDGYWYGMDGNNEVVGPFPSEAGADVIVNPEGDE